MTGLKLCSCEVVEPGIKPNVLGRHTNRPYAHEKTLNIIGQQGNANQSHRETALHTQEGGY